MNVLRMLLGWLHRLTSCPKTPEATPSRAATSSLGLLGAEPLEDRCLLSATPALVPPASSFRPDLVHARVLGSETRSPQSGTAINLEKVSLANVALSSLASLGTTGQSAQDAVVNQPNRLETDAMVLDPDSDTDSQPNGRDASWETRFRAPEAGSNALAVSSKASLDLLPRSASPSASRATDPSLALTTGQKASAAEDLGGPARVSGGDNTPHSSLALKTRLLLVPVNDAVALPRSSPGKSVSVGSVRPSASVADKMSLSSEAGGDADAVSHSGRMPGLLPLTSRFHPSDAWTRDILAELAAFQKHMHLLLFGSQEERGDFLSSALNSGERTFLRSSPLNTAHWPSSLPPRRST